MSALRQLDSDQARKVLGDWLALYNRCFSTPPWNEPVRSLDEYRAKVAWHLDQAGFRALEVRRDTSVVAVAYGWPAVDDLPDRSFYQTLAASLGPVRMRRLWMARPFEVVELMVDPTARRQGLAKRLLDGLCPRAGTSWLATHSDAPAVGVYRRLGWQWLGSGVTSDGTPLDYFVRGAG